MIDPVHSVCVHPFFETKMGEGEYFLCLKGLKGTISIFDLRLGFFKNMVLHREVKPTCLRKKFVRRISGEESVEVLRVCQEICSLILSRSRICRFTLVSESFFKKSDVFPTLPVLEEQIAFTERFCQNSMDILTLHAYLEAMSNISLTAEELKELFEKRQIILIKDSLAKLKSPPVGCLVEEDGLLVSDSGDTVIDQVALGHDLESSSSKTCGSSLIKTLYIISFDEKKFFFSHMQLDLIQCDIFDSKNIMINGARARYPFLITGQEIAEMVHEVQASGILQKKYIYHPEGFSIFSIEMYGREIACCRYQDITIPFEEPNEIVLKIIEEIKNGRVAFPVTLQDSELKKFVYCMTEAGGHLDVKIYTIQADDEFDDVVSQLDTKGSFLYTSVLKAIVYGKVEEKFIIIELKDTVLSLRKKTYGLYNALVVCQDRTKEERISRLCSPFRHSPKSRYLDFYRQAEQNGEAHLLVVDELKKEFVELVLKKDYSHGVFYIDCKLAFLPGYLSGKLEDLLKSEIVDSVHLYNGWLVSVVANAALINSGFGGLKRECVARLDRNFIGFHIREDGCVSVSVGTYLDEGIYKIVYKVDKLGRKNTQYVAAELKVENEHALFKEYSSLRDLQHRNILGARKFVSRKMITFYGLWNVLQWSLLQTEYCDKRTCKSLDENVPRSLEEWRERALIIKQVTEGMAFVHSKKLCVCDFKPENIFLKTEADGSVVAKIGDLGAKPEGVRSVFSVLYVDRLYKEMNVLGNVASKANDVWALAVTTFNFAYGFENNPFFKANTFDEIYDNFEGYRQALFTYLNDDSLQHVTHEQLNNVLARMFQDRAMRPSLDDAFRQELAAAVDAWNPEFSTK